MKKERLCEPTYLGQITFDVLRNDFHRPVVDGKCNREKIADAIFDGIYKSELEAMNEKDVAFVCDLIDDMIGVYGV
jgi:hypothetical protein